MNLFKLLAFCLFCLIGISAAPASAPAPIQPESLSAKLVEPAASLTVLSSSSARLDYSGFGGSGAYTVSWWPHDAPDSKTYAYPTASTYTITGLSSGYWDFKVERGADFIIIESGAI